jgi:hypothetical protein
MTHPTIKKTNLGGGKRMTQNDCILGAFSVGLREITTIQTSKKIERFTVIIDLVGFNLAP